MLFLVFSRIKPIVHFTLKLECADSASIVAECTCIQTNLVLYLSRTCIMALGYHDEGLEVCHSFLALSSFKQISVFQCYFISAWCHFTLERLVLFSLNHNLRSTLSTTPSTRTSSYGWGDIRQSVLTLYPDYVCLVYGWIPVYIMFNFW